MSEITIVTAYFDIGRDKWKGFERGNNKYINYFKFWARINNKVIIYTSPEFEEEIRDIRKDFGLEKRTKIIIINDFRDFDKNLYYRMKNVMNNDTALLFHKETHRPEAWSWDYNYIMILKTYCIIDAIKNNYADGLIAWMDFGYNHGGKDGLINANDFDFLWEYNFSPKIHLFTERTIDNGRPIFDIVRSMDVYIRGNLMIAPDFLWKEFHVLSVDSMISLTRCGLCDDDQTISLMAYYEKPDLFEIHDVDYWYSGLKDFGGEYFWVRKEEPIKIKVYRKHKDKAWSLLADGKVKKALKEYIIYTKKRLLSKIKQL